MTISDGPGNQWSALAFTNAVDMTTAANSNFGSINNGYGQLYVNQIGFSIETLSYTGVLTQPVVSIGTNSTSYNNILSTSLLSSLTTILLGFTATNKSLFIPVNWVIDAVDDAVNVYFKVNTAASVIGGSITNYKWNVTLWGYYF